MLHRVLSVAPPMLPRQPPLFVEGVNGKKTGGNVGVMADDAVNSGIVISSDFVVCGNKLLLLLFLVLWLLLLIFKIGAFGELGGVSDNSDLFKCFGWFLLRTLSRSCVAKYECLCIFIIKSRTIHRRHQCDIYFFF